MRLFFALIGVVVIFSSCKNGNNVEDSTPTSVILTGEIINPVNDTLLLFFSPKPTKVILTDGHFRFEDTLSIPRQIRFSHGEERSELYLTPNDSIHLELNTEQFDESLTFSGIGSGPNNYLIANYLREETDFDGFYMCFALKKKQFLSKIDTFYTAKEDFLAKSKDLINDSIFFNREKELLAYQKINDKFDFPQYHSYYRKTKEALTQPKSYFNDLIETFNSRNEELSFSKDYKILVSNYIYQELLTINDSVNFSTQYSDTTQILFIEKMNGLISNNYVKSELLEVKLKGFQSNFDFDNLKKYLPLYDSLVQDKSKPEKFRTLINKLESLSKGNDAPSFSYPDRNGNIVSLDSLKGKAVYIDVWATWCGPCKREIPYLKELEKEYHDENIVFMSVSVDVEKDKQRWLDFIDEKEMTGVQLFASGWSEITDDYIINSIPRFILIDKDGRIVDSNAPRPSSDEIKNLLNEIL